MGRYAKGKLVVTRHDTKCIFCLQKIRRRHDFMKKYGDLIRETKRNLKKNQRMYDRTDAKFNPNAKEVILQHIRRDQAKIIELTDNVSFLNKDLKRLQEKYHEAFVNLISE